MSSKMAYEGVLPIRIYHRGALTPAIKIEFESYEEAGRVNAVVIPRTQYQAFNVPLRASLRKVKGTMSNASERATVTITARTPRNLES
jgi:hypothetical protein